MKKPNLYLMNLMLVGWLFEVRSNILCTWVGIVVAASVVPNIVVD